MKRLFTLIVLLGVTMVVLSGCNEGTNPPAATPDTNAPATPPSTNK